jgi:starvation-inducible DNA-binding protein
MKPTIEISDSHLKEVATLLNKILANEYLIYTKTRAAHWNIEGPNFIGLHLFFQTQYEELDGTINDIAERVRSLGHFTLSSLKDFLAVTDLLENHEVFGSQARVISALLDGHETIIRTIRNEIATISDKNRDLGTADFVTGIVEKHEKMVWMLRAHLSGS